MTNKNTVNFHISNRWKRDIKNRKSYLPCSLLNILYCYYIVFFALELKTKLVYLFSQENLYIMYLKRIKTSLKLVFEKFVWYCKTDDVLFFVLNQLEKY